MIVTLAQVSFHDGDFLLKIIAGLSVLANFVLLMRKVSGGAEKREISPDPLNVKAHPEYVSRPDFHKHAELNRDAHTAIEERLTEAVEKIQEHVGNLTREVGEIKTAREHNGELLNGMRRELNELSKTVHELAGVVHQFLRTSGGSKR